jgi:hypothetical protein
VADPDALYVVWAGGNGFQGLDPLVAAANVVQAVEDLAALGARHLVPNLPDLSLTPQESGDAQRALDAAWPEPRSADPDEALASRIHRLAEEFRKALFAYYGLLVHDQR